MDSDPMTDRRTPRIEIPLLVDDADLSPYGFRLYAHIKRRAGDTGTCWAGTRALAGVCNMSVGQVSKAKAELRAAGLVAFEQRAVKGGMVDEIRVIDVWAANAEQYPSVHTVNTNEPTVQEVNTNPEGVQEVNASAVSVHTVNTKQENDEFSVHQVNETRSLDISNDHDLVDLASDDAAVNTPLPIRKPRKGKNAPPAEPPTPIAIRLVIADACSIDLEGGMATKGQITNLNATAKTIWTNAQKQGKTEQECIDAIKYVAGWIKRTVYPYSNGQPIKPAALLERWKGAMEARPKLNGTHANGAAHEPYDYDSQPSPYELRRLEREALRSAGGGK